MIIDSTYDSSYYRFTNGAERIIMSHYVEVISPNYNSDGLSHQAYFTSIEERDSAINECIEIAERWGTKYIAEFDNDAAIQIIWR